MCMCLWVQPTLHYLVPLGYGFLARTTHIFFGFYSHTRRVCTAFTYLRFLALFHWAILLVLSYSFFALCYPIFLPSAMLYFFSLCSALFSFALHNAIFLACVMIFSCVRHILFCDMLSLFSCLEHIFSVYCWTIFFSPCAYFYCPVYFFVYPAQYYSFSCPLCFLSRALVHFLLSCTIFCVSVHYYFIALRELPSFYSLLLLHTVLIIFFTSHFTFLMSFIPRDCDPICFLSHHFFMVTRLAILLFSMLSRY